MIGAVGQPYLGEVFLGGPSGARLLKGGGETPLKTRACPDLSQALIATTDPEIFLGADRAAWDRLRAAARLARLGCDAYAYAMVAAGRIDLVAESELKVWDWSALKPLVEAAGGRFTDWRGDSPNEVDGRVLAVGDARLTAQARPLLGDA
jgi:fructose-1,6-bisphosphatase/inositol monophosphatase family enzyme